MTYKKKKTVLTEMTPEQARAIVREQQRRADLKFPPWIRDMHEAQVRFWRDKGRFKIALCGRRAGKTQVAVRGLLEAANSNPESIAAYLGVTRENARRLAWGPLQRIAKKYDCPFKFNRTELTGYHENGAEIWILGADREDDIAKVLGPAYSRFIVDEAASYRSFIERLVTEGVEPALGDFRGDVWLTGSPGYACTGFYYKASTNQDFYKKWHVHHWTVLDNPYFPDARQFLDEVLERNGWDKDHPVFKRQWLGQWIHDESALVYKFDETKNLTDRPIYPLEDHTLVLSIDFGVVDPCAFIVNAFHPNDPCVYILESSEHPDMSPSDCVEKVRLLRDSWGVQCDRHPDIAFERVVGDTPGIGKAFAQEMSKRHGIWIETAEKRHKMAFIDLMNGELLAGRIKLIKDQCQSLISNWQTLPWKMKDDKKLPEYDDRRYDDHSADAALYGWRACRSYQSIPKPIGLPNDQGVLAKGYADAVELEEVRARQTADEEQAEFEKYNYGYPDDDEEEDHQEGILGWF